MIYLCSKYYPTQASLIRLLIERGPIVFVARVLMIVLKFHIERWQCHRCYWKSNFVIMH